MAGVDLAQSLVGDTPIRLGKHTFVLPAIGEEQLADALFAFVLDAFEAV